jgi:hypothetical protein
MEVTMFAYAFILILFLPFTFLPLALDTLFSPKELSDMGIRLEYSQTIEECEHINTVSQRRLLHTAEEANPLRDVSQQPQTINLVCQSAHG